jgi:hypothetical protein
MTSSFHSLALGSATPDAPDAGYAQASISAQLRHFRKERFGGQTIDRKHLGNGLFAYRLLSNVPALEAIVAAMANTDPESQRMRGAPRELTRQQRDQDLGGSHA